MKKEIFIKVFASAAKEAIVDDGKKIKIYVRTSAQHGSANRAACLLLARHFNCPAKNVVITRGHTSPNKMITIY